MLSMCPQDSVPYLATLQMKKLRLEGSPATRIQTQVRVTPACVPAPRFPMSREVYTTFTLVTLVS